MHGSPRRVCFQNPNSRSARGLRPVPEVFRPPLFSTGSPPTSLRVVPLREKPSPRAHAPRPRRLLLPSEPPPPPLGAQPALPRPSVPASPATATQGRAQTLPVSSAPRTHVGGFTWHCAGTTPASRSLRPGQGPSPGGLGRERGGDHPSLEVAAPARQAPQHPSLSWLSDTSTARRHCCRRHWGRPATLVHDTSDSKPRQLAEQGTKNVTMSRRTHVRSRLERGQIPRLVAVGRAVGVRAPVEVTVPRLGTPVPRKDVSTRIRKERFRREQWARRGRTSWRAGHLCAATPCR